MPTAEQIAGSAYPLDNHIAEMQRAAFIHGAEYMQNRARQHNELFASLTIKEALRLIADQKTNTVKFSQVMSALDYMVEMAELREEFRVVIKDIKAVTEKIRSL